MNNEHQPSSLLKKVYMNIMRENLSSMAGAQGIQIESGVSNNNLHFPYIQCVFYLVNLFSLLARIVRPTSLAQIKAEEVFFIDPINSLLLTISQA